MDFGNINTARFRADNSKFKELVLYISSACENDDTFGATKLNKILFYSDFLAYFQLGTPITGHPYQRLPNGPAPRRLLPLQSELVNANELAIQERTHFGHKQKRPVALRDANLAIFSSPEIAIVDEIVRAFWGLTATEVSRRSHRFAGYNIVNDGETIPYQSVFFDPTPLTPDECLYGKELAASFGL